MKLIPFAVFLSYVFFAVIILTSGHLHEDAYILYIYAKNLAGGHGISYFPGGGPAEGSTDFLWMILLALSEAAGLDSALTAALLNGTGLAIICWLALKLASTDSRPLANIVPAFLLTALLLSSQITQASLAGFSTGFYCSLIAVLFFLLYQPHNRLRILIPVVSIILGLIRPDGVIVGVTATLIGGYEAYRINALPQYLKTAMLCALIGLFYFVWRYHYFGYWLPLPLYVKSDTPTTLPGLTGHIHWARNNAYLGLAALIALVVLRQRWRIVTASVPVGILLVALMFATQTQNVADRFQAPATTLLILWLAILSATLMRRAENASKISLKVVASGIGVLAVIALEQNLTATRYLTSYLRTHEYINSFPHRLAPVMPANTTIALTEAGRFALWSPGKKFDLVGLNTPEVAVNKLSPDYLTGLDPDLIFFHEAGTASYTNSCQGNICELSVSAAIQGIRQQQAWHETHDPVVRAPLVIYDHLRNNPARYRIFAVMYNNDYRHIYLVKQDGQLNMEEFIAALEWSFKPDAETSYWQLSM